MGKRGAAARQHHVDERHDKRCQKSSRCGDSCHHRCRRVTRRGRGGSCEAGRTPGELPGRRALGLDLRGDFAPGSVQALAHDPPFPPGVHGQRHQVVLRPGRPRQHACARDTTCQEARGQMKARPRATLAVRSPPTWKAVLEPGGARHQAQARKSRRAPAPPALAARHVRRVDVDPGPCNNAAPPAFSAF